MAAVIDGNKEEEERAEGTEREDGGDRGEQRQTEEDIAEMNKARGGRGGGV